MDFEEPDWQFRWTSAPLGETWPVQVYLLSALPLAEDLGRLADRSQQAHSVDSVEGVMLGWASDHDLTLERFYAQGAVSVRFGLG